MLYLPLLFAAPLLDAILHAVFARTRLSAVLAGLAAVALSVACWERSAVYADRGAYHQAILAVEPGDAQAHLELAEVFEQAGQPERARGEYVRAVALAPRNALGHIGLGRVAAARGDAATAANEFGIATHLAPSSLEAWRGLARARFEHGDREAATDALGHALALDPNDPATLALAARMRDT
jgi:Tfp pilus assembly protein PilF